MVLDKIKTALRISHDKLDEDIMNNIDACRMDLKRVGVNVSESDALIDKACELYCKYQYDYQNKGEQFRQSYESLRDALSLCDDYKNTDAGK